MCFHICTAEFMHRPTETNIDCQKFDTDDFNIALMRDWEPVRGVVKWLARWTFDLEIERLSL